MNYLTPTQALAEQCIKEVRGILNELTSPAEVESLEVSTIGKTMERVTCKISLGKEDSLTLYLTRRKK